MVKHNRINPKTTSPGHLSSQETQVAIDLGPSQATWGRKYQRQQRDKEVDRELELGRKLSIEDIRLLQNVKSYRNKDFRSRVGSYTSKK